jgi:hypothetical protein
MIFKSITVFPEKLLTVQKNLPGLPPQIIIGDVPILVGHILGIK